MTLQSWWKPVAAGLAAIALVSVAWTKGADLISSSFLATDSEVDIKVGVVTLRIDETVDPQIIVLTANQDVLTKGQAVIVWQGARANLERNEDRLFKLGLDLKLDPNNPVMVKRKRTLLRNISDGENEVRRTHCAVLTLDGKIC